MDYCSSSESDYTTVWSAPPKKPSGRTKFKETRHPIYRGVRRRGTLNRWVCEARNPNNKSKIWLGTFPTAEMAARAHDVAVMALQGHSACLNFADSAWLVSIPPSFLTVKELKQAAFKTAEALHSKNLSDSAENFSSSSSSSSSSSIETIDETEVISSSLTVSKSNPVANDEMYSNWDGDVDMNLGLYYASLVEGLMFDHRLDWFSDLDDNQWCTPVSLWS